MANDGSISSATDSIIGLLQQSGTANNDLSSLTEDVTIAEKQEGLVQTQPDTEQETKATQPDSEVAVVDETVEVGEDSVEPDEQPIQETEIVSDEPTDEYYTVKVQGETYDVNLDELKAGYQRESDYRRKTESLSIEKQQHVEQMQKDSAVVQEKLNSLDKLNQMARQQLDLDAGDLNELMQKDPVEGMRKKHALEQRAMQLQAQEEEARKIRANEMQKVLAEEEKKMYLRIPEMRDPVKKQKFVNNMRSYLTSLDFTDREINGVTDSRYVSLISDGMKWRELQKSKPNIAKKVQNTPKVLRGGVATSKGVRQKRSSDEKMARLKKTGSLDDASAILKDIFG